MSWWYQSRRKGINGMRKAMLTRLVVVALLTIAMSVGFPLRLKAAAAGGTTLTIMYPPPRALPPANDPIKAELESKLGVTLRVTNPPLEVYLEKINIQMASRDMPDIFTCPWQNDWRKFADEGAITPLDQYLPEFPNLNKLPKADWEKVTYKGKVYAVPVGGFRNFAGLFIRKDWLDKLGLPIPKTMDEMYTVLKAFTENDPDGNGRRDTYGLTGQANGVDGWCFQWAFGAYGSMYSSMRSIYAVNRDRSGVVDMNLDSANAQALKWLNRLHSERILDPEWVVNTPDQIHMKAAQGKVGCVWYTWNLPYVLDTRYNLKEVDPKAQWIEIRPPAGPGGASSLGKEQGLVAVIMVSSNCKNPRIALQLLDYMASEEGRKLVNYGIENKHYKYVNGNLVFTEEGQQDWVSHYAILKVGFDSDFWTSKYGMYGKILENLALNMPLTADASDGLVTEARKKYDADLIGYVNEMYSRFIMGEEPISNWSRFVETARKKYHADEIGDSVVQALKRTGMVR